MQKRYYGMVVATMNFRISLKVIAITTHAEYYFNF